MQTASYDDDDDDKKRGHEMHLMVSPIERNVSASIHISVGSASGSIADVSSFVLKWFSLHNDLAAADGLRIVVLFVLVTENN